MYEESRGRFTVRDIILQLLIVVLFVFLLVWLFPTKGYIDSKVDPLLDTIFNTNIITMKDAAKDYYTLSRLPQNVGDKTKMTLREMIEKKLVLPFTDKYGEECDLDASYVEITKYEDEYVMKVNLKCSKQEDYILVHMGCYDYCSTTICENKEKEITDSCGKTVTPTIIPDPEPKPVYTCQLVNGIYYGKNSQQVSYEKFKEECGPDEPTPVYTCQIVNGVYYGKYSTVVDKATYEKECLSPTPTPPTPDKKYICEYQLSTDGYYTPWEIGEWTEEKKAEIAGTFEVNDTKTETQTKEVTSLTGYEYKEFYDGNQPKYDFYNVVTGKTATTTKTCKTVTTYTATVTTTYGGDTYMGTVTSNTPLTSNGGDTYSLVSANNIICDINCSSAVSTIYTYNMYSKSENKTYTTVTNDGGVTECTETTTYTPIVESVKVLKSFEKAWVRTPVYKTTTLQKKVTYYQYKSRSWIGGSTDTKWSNCNDQGLLKKGYVLTGKRKEVD